MGIFLCRQRWGLPKAAVAGIAFILWAWVGLVSVASGQSELRPPFEGLPESTRLAFRLDSTQEAQRVIRESTALGELLLSDDRVDGYKSYISTLLEDEDNIFSKWMLGFEERGLEVEDIFAMAESKIGAAMADVPTSVGDVMPTIYFWAELDEALAEKVFDSVLESSADSETVGREDEMIAGELVVRVRSLDTGSSYLLSRLGNRILYIIGMPLPEANVMENGDAYEAAEEEAMGYFIEGQRSGNGGFLERLYSAEGIASAKPEAYAVMELAGDFKDAVDLIPDIGEIPWDRLGGDSLEDFGLWVTLDSDAAHTNLFVSTPEPREGVASLLGQEEFQFQPEAWVPADVKAYTVMSFDMARAYAVGLDLARRFLPPAMVESQLGKANEQLDLLFQTSVAGIADSFGSRIHILEYEPKFVELNVGGVSIELPTESMAFVVDFENEELIENAFAMFGAMAEDEEAGIRLIDEQGFQGVRISGGVNPGDTVVVAYGGGRLIYAVGSNTASELFSVLNNPPEGSFALRNDERYREFVNGRSIESASLFSYGDGSKVFTGLEKTYEGLISAFIRNKDGPSSERLEEFRALFPSEDEMAEIFGGIFSRGYSDAYGYHLVSLSELN